MHNQSTLLPLAFVVLIMASIANADLILTLNSVDAAKQALEIKGKDNLVIAVAGQRGAKVQEISVTCDRGKLESLTRPGKRVSGKYLFTFTGESEVATISLNVGKEVVYQLVLFYNPEIDTVIAFGINLEALNFTPPPQPEQQVSKSETSGFETFSVGDCNDILDPNWYPNLNDDQLVNLKDFAILAANWQRTGSDLEGDLNSSEAVDFSDLAILAYYWLANTTGPSPEEVFESFKNALLANDVNKAVSFFTEISAENYQPFLEQLRPYFQQMVNDMGEMIFIRSDTDMAVYDLLREESGRTYGYPVTFIRDEKGQWKIYDF